MDYYGISYHGQAATHIDALCHVWDGDGMYNGRDPEKEITFDGATFGAVDNWADGIITRGVLLDIPKHRGEPFVAQEKPVHGWELEDVARSQGVAVEPGDAVVVYSGREAWQESYAPYGATDPNRPGLHSSCLPFLRDNDVSVLVWGHDGREPQRLRPALGGAWGNIRIRNSFAGQCPATAAGGGLRRGRAL